MCIEFVSFIFQVQKTASAIKTRLEADDIEPLNANVSSQVSEAGRIQDKAAGVWTSVFCELSRYD